MCFYYFPGVEAGAAKMARQTPKHMRSGLMKRQFRDAGREIRSKHGAGSCHDIVTMQLMKKAVVWVTGEVLTY